MSHRSGPANKIPHGSEIPWRYPDIAKHGFQYADWLFDGNDIVLLSRTAYDDNGTGAHNCHDANYMTFHRIKDFRKALTEQAGNR